MGNIQLYNEDNLKVMATLPDESIDVICIDPPYLYLKGQKLERPFDEHLFFSECQRLLTKTGFIVMFGRGVSFYRWNCILADLGFEFKEEIIWDKQNITSPTLPLGRLHETISIFTKKKGTINRVKVPYLEMKGHNIEAISKDIKQLKVILKNPKELENIQNYIELKDNEEDVSIYKIAPKKRTEKFKINLQNTPSVCSRILALYNSIRTGTLEKSIIKIPREHFSFIHPTQKPVRLLERLLALVIPKDKEAKDIVVADFFAGSMSCMEAVHNMGMQGIACEIDEEYFNAGKQRIENLQPKLAFV